MYQEPHPMGGTDGEPEPRGCKEGGKSMAQDELSLTEEEIIAKCELSPKTAKLLKDMSEETYKEIAREIIFLAKPIILAKVKQHYVKWDREKVVSLLIEADKRTCLVVYNRVLNGDEIESRRKQGEKVIPLLGKLADQLKEILTGGE